ncbi:MAG: helix-turn-helix domain-containing protein [Draconibacterium sp.]
MRYKVTLTKNERSELQEIIKKGKRSAQIIRNALILLNCDCGESGNKKTSSEIASVLQIGERTIDRVKKLFVGEGFEVAAYGLGRAMARPQQRALDGDAEAHLVSLCCSDPPEGFAKWSLRLLADRMVQLEYATSVSHETIRKTLKKTNLNLGK